MKKHILCAQCSMLLKYYRFRFSKSNEEEETDDDVHDDEEKWGERKILDRERERDQKKTVSRETEEGNCDA